MDPGPGTDRPYPPRDGPLPSREGPLPLRGGPLPPRERPIRAVLGLGNPGPRYEKTRHNAGFLVVESIRSSFRGRWNRRGERDDAEIATPAGGLLLSRPLTFMNRSGDALRSLLSDHGLVPEEVLVVLDDVALPEGRLRFRPSGGAGGHKGLISILAEAGTQEVARLRVGVGSPPPGVEMVDFVLEAMTGGDGERLERIAAAAGEAALLASSEGIAAAMNRFNPRWIEGFAPPEEPGGEAGGPASKPGPAGGNAAD